MTAAEIIARLDLAPHPEGGWYRQTWIEDGRSDRPAGTAIYYLLEADQRSHWHRVDATEIWHWYAGSDLELQISPGDDGPVAVHRLGSDLASGARPQVIVPKDAWQSARTVDGWGLVGCTVSPGFRFDGFEMAPVGWAPAGS